MRSNVVLVVVLLLGCILSFASPALPSAPSPDSSPFSISEYEVDRDGLWTDHEIPLSDASMEAIRQATPATDSDIAAWNAEAEPGMQVQAVIEEDEEPAETEAEPENETEGDTEAESDNESETAEPIDDLEITHGHHGRMFLIPRSRHLMMRRVIMYLKHLISKMKARSPLARIELKLKIEPVTTPTPTPHRPRMTPVPVTRRPPPSLGIIHRPRPVSLRLVPSRASMQTRRLLARCSMLLRMALKRLHQMRRKLMKAKMKKHRRYIRGLQFPGRGVILFRSNNITTTAPSYTRASNFKFEIEGERNGTVTIIAPRVNATLSHSIIVINRGTIILLNRSRNNTFAATLPSHHARRRRFPIIPARSHHIMTADENEIDQPTA